MSRRRSDVEEVRRAGGERGVQRSGFGRDGQGVRTGRGIFPEQTMKWFFCMIVLCIAPAAQAEQWDYKKEFLHNLTDEVPKLLKSQNKETGAFGTEPWICTDQNLIFPLAAAWAIKDDANPWYHKQEVLDAVMLGGDKLIAEQKPSGKWIFRNK